ncbi:hypothetical protein LTS18_004954, partial [Coniosporium uncinatum]
PPPGLEKFYSRDAFMCDWQGLPIYCEKCSNWKPDRVHHSSEVDRCVRRMDHFCPWAGGMISETSQKFFMQFVFYATIYTGFTWITLAILLAERKRITGDVNVHWAVVLGLGVLFFLFNAGMVGKSLQLAFQNLTTVEELTKGTRTEFVAVLVPRPNDQLPPVPPRTSRSNLPYQPTPFMGTITYPLQQPLSRTPSHQSSRGESASNSQSSALPANARTFAILRVPSGTNLWDINPRENLKSIFGSNVFEWILPIKYSPCCDHGNLESQYPFGPELEYLKTDAGLARSSLDNRKRRHRRHHSDGRRLSGDAVGYRHSGGSGNEESHRHGRRKRRHSTHAGQDPS